ncbi:MAG: hypothetical protein SGJ04_01290, partial [Bacteroidota bacterium]|nr:hypothetical protein [Bacteroidota bacterium]
MDLKESNLSLNFFRISKGVNLVPQASAPSSPVNGDFYYDSTLLNFRFYVNGSWTIFPLTNDIVVGPVSSTDNAIARFDLTTGKLIQNSVVTVDDTGILAGASISASSNTLT